MEYNRCSTDPDKYDVYLVKTEEGCYDFALFDIEGWRVGKTTGGTPKWWMAIPTTDNNLVSEDEPRIFSI